MKIKLLMMLMAFLPSGISAQTPVRSRITAAPNKCYVGDSSRYMIDSNIEKYAQAATEGDLSAARAIVAYLRPRAEGSKPNSIVGCQLKVWQELAAANGDTQSAYELAFGADRNDWYSCGRAKYWASFFIRRISMSAMPTSSDIALEVAQMKRVLSNVCPKPQ